MARGEIDVTKISAGCLCGEIRFEADATPIMAGLCYCTDCQQVSGSQFYAAYLVDLESGFNLLKGSPLTHKIVADSGRAKYHKFCPNCGSRVWAEVPEQGFASINGFAFDDKNHFKPQFNHMSDSAPSWCAIDRSLEEV